MKQIIFIVFMFLGFTGVAMAAADYQGYNKFLQDNKDKLKDMDMYCKASNGVVINAAKCNELAQMQLQAQCKYGVNPNACKALDEVKKTTSGKKSEETIKVDDTTDTTTNKVKAKESKLKNAMKTIK